MISGTFLEGSNDECILVCYDVGEIVGEHYVVVSNIKYLTNSGVVTNDNIEINTSNVLMAENAKNSLSILVQPVPPKIPYLNYTSYASRRQVTTRFSNPDKLEVEYISVTVDGVLIEKLVNIRYANGYEYYEWYFGEYESAEVVWRYKLDGEWHVVTTIINYWRNKKY
ncbi:MAG TPA: hypothetical protein VIL23_00350 [Clostridia bacterium]